MKKQITLIITTVLIVLLITIGLSYAYFTANLTGVEDSTTITVKGGSMNIYYSGGPVINTQDIVPSDRAFATKIFTVTGNNNTHLEMAYKISFVVTKNTFSSDALKYKLISTNTDYNGDVAPSINELTNIGTGEQIIDLGVGYFDNPTTGNKVHTYILEIYFPNQDYNQNEDMGKEIKGHILIENSELLFDNFKGVNKPVLFTGMMPIKWDSHYNEIETTTNDPEWYDYDNKKWANAKTQDGSYWVWIPRYAYKITTGYHSSETGIIDIKFLKGRANESFDNTPVETEGYIAHVKDTSMHYFLHPAFIFNKDELGFWVAKFEPTAAEGVASGISTCLLEDNVISKTLKIVPNETSWRCINIANAFEVSLNLKNKSVYGWNQEELDSHLMKNTEWGAVTYLSKSIYGANTEEIWNNAYNQYRTGCSGTKVNAFNESICTLYNTENGVKASTTHNIYGIYDTNGGAWERVMGNYNDLVSDSGFDDLKTIDSKYITRYKTLDTDLLNNIGLNYDLTIYGDAMFETSNNAARYDGTSWIGNISGSWFGEESYLPRTIIPWVYRGGHWNYGVRSGTFIFHDNKGEHNLIATFRPVLTPK